jgi:2-hydroxychromene-2-carboxylate isomerase
MSSRTRRRSSGWVLCDYENRQHRASGLNLVVAAVALWNTVYLERAVRTLLERGFSIDQRLLALLSPLKWEHINLTEEEDCVMQWNHGQRTDGVTMAAHAMRSSATRGRDPE